MSKVYRSGITEIQKAFPLYCIMVPFFYLLYSDIHCSIIPYPNFAKITLKMRGFHNILPTFNYKLVVLLDLLFR